MKIDNLPSSLVEELSNQILHIKISRAEKMNSLSFEMYRALTKMVNDVERNDDVKVVLISGEKECFCAGNDIDDFIELQQNQSFSRNHVAPSFIDTLIHFPKPIIAAVEGVAVGIGTTMLLHCDLVYASPEASFSMPFVKLGLSPEAAASYIMPQLMGRARAAEWLLLGDTITSDQALKDGLLTAVVEDPLEIALQSAKTITVMSTQAILATKKLMSHDSKKRMKTFDREMVEFLKCFTSEPVKAAFEAFVAKRASHKDE